MSGMLYLVSLFPQHNYNFLHFTGKEIDSKNLSKTSKVK